MSLFIQRYSAWTDEKNMPRLSFVPMLFRRRLSDLSKMVAYVVHDVSDGFSPAPMTFASEFGEIQRQFQISSGILESGEVSRKIQPVRIQRPDCRRFDHREQHDGIQRDIFRKPFL